MRTYRRLIPYSPRKPIPITPILDAVAAKEAAMEAERAAVAALTVVSDQYRGMVQADRCGNDPANDAARRALGVLVDERIKAHRDAAGETYRFEDEAKKRFQSLHAAIRFKAMPDQVADEAAELLREADLDDLSPADLGGKTFHRVTTSQTCFVFTFDDEGKNLFLTGIGVA